MVKVKQLSKRFGNLQVLKGIDLEFQSGNITAIVGPNGSGKTTLIKSILGLVKPDEGDICINGTTRNTTYEYRKWIGYMPQIGHFPENLRVEEIILMIKDLRQAPEEDIDQELVRQFGLEKEFDKPMRTLSGGTRQKVSAVLAFSFHPQILILDEPTAGLDPVSSRILKEKIWQEKDRGKTVILTSHIMSEVESLADRIVFLLEGEIYYDGSPARLKEDVGEQDLERSIARMMEEGVVA